MKKLFSFVALVGIIFVSNCSRIPENNDPVIGVWTRLEVQTVTDSEKHNIRREWIFNDAYLGRFHRIEDGKIVIKTDFKWKFEDGKYSISYPGIDRPTDVVILKTAPDKALLERIDGFQLAARE
jgi:hypothetical protein